VGGINCRSLENEIRDKVMGLFSFFFLSVLKLALKKNCFSTVTMDATRVLILKLHKKGGKY
jgi:hypothetical protein